MRCEQLNNIFDNIWPCNLLTLQKRQAMLKIFFNNKFFIFVINLLSIRILKQITSLSLKKYNRQRSTKVF